MYIHLCIYIDVHIFKLFKPILIYPDFPPICLMTHQQQPNSRYNKYVII